MIVGGFPLGGVGPPKMIAVGAGIKFHRLNSTASGALALVTWCCVCKEISRDSGKRRPAKLLAKQAELCQQKPQDSDVCCGKVINIMLIGLRVVLKARRLQPSCLPSTACYSARHKVDEFRCNILQLLDQAESSIC